MAGPILLEWTALDNCPPASIAAAFGTRNNHPVLLFDGATDEEAVFMGVMPLSWDSVQILTASFWVSFTSATSGTARFQFSLERMTLSNLDTDADNFPAFSGSLAFTAPGTSGQVVKGSVSLSGGGLSSPGEAFRFKVRRDADGTSGTDDITTDLELHRITFVQ